jgi:GNAT superfamily N-acetyltransferase
MSCSAPAIHYEGTAPVEVKLRDGEIATVRELTVEDEPALREFLAALCLEARRFRFFTAAVNIPSMADYIGETAPGRLGLVALDRQGTMIGHAFCIELEPGRAEVAVEVADRVHGHGLGTILMRRLAAAAERRGITHFVAEVLPENRAMLDVFRDGFDARVTLRRGVDLVEFPTSAWRLAGAKYPDAPVPQQA